MSLLPDNILSILVACLIVLLVILVRKRLDYFTSRCVVHVKPTWMSMLKSVSPTYLLKYPDQIYHKMRETDNSIVGYFDMFLKPVYLAVDPEMVQKIFIKDFSHFHDHGIELDLVREPLAGHLFNMNGEKWRALRNKLLPTFTSGKLKGMIPTIDECARSVTKEMNRDTSLWKDVKLKELFKKFTVAVIASCAFGIEPESVKDPNCEYQQKLRKVLSPSVVDQIRLFFLISFPKVTKCLKLKIFPQDVDDFFLNLTRDTMEMRKRSGVKRNDFVQLLLELKEKGSVEVDHKDLEEDEKKLLKQQQQLVESESTSKLEMTDELLTAQAFVFIAAGFDNTAYLIAITNYVLSKNRDIQQRVREEVRAAKSKHGGINYEALKDMKLLDASINEALRMFPPLYYLFRVCTKTYTLSNGATVEKGSMVLIPSKSLQNDTKYWKNPEEFNPDRFLTDDILPGTYMPFGDGPRLCIAQRLALLMAKVMLSDLIDNYQLLPSNKNKEPLTPKIMVASEMEGGLWGSYEPLQR